MAITLTLTQGITVSLDLTSQTLRQRNGPPLNKNVADWCREIGIYLTRMAVLQRHEQEHPPQQTGEPLTFTPKPHPNQIWWG
jgi:hypothetical protein